MTAQVFVETRGGIAYAQSTAGDVDIIEIDWDNFDDNEPDEEWISEAREELERIADPDIRAEALRGLDEEVARIAAYAESDALLEAERQKRRIEEAREVLAEAGESPWAGKVPPR